MKTKILILLSTFFFFNSALASITLVKKQRANVEEEAALPVDNSYINELDNQSLFEQTTNSYDSELDFIDELKPEPVNSANNNSITNKLSSSDLENLNGQAQN